MAVSGEVTERRGFNASTRVEILWQCLAFARPSKSLRSTRVEILWQCLAAQKSYRKHQIYESRNFVAVSGAALQVVQAYDLRE